MRKELQDAIEYLRSKHQEAWKDKAWAEKTRQYMKRRERVRGEILDLLRTFTAGKLTLAEFKSTFDKKTRKEWDGFGLKGMSGAMFLNTMTLHLPNQEEVAHRLKSTLAAPTNEADGREKMADFYGYLNNIMSHHRIPLRKLQPRRTPFFISAWWHLQDQDAWPIFYASARTVLADNGLVTDSGDPVEDYFRFRSVWLDLRHALDIVPWDIELLCVRISKGEATVIDPQPQPPGVEPIDAHDPIHSEVQGLLAELGHKLGCKVWIAANDHAKQWKAQKLKSYSLPSLPNLGMGEDAQKIINLIDVIWLKGGKHVVAAFEVESTTSIFSGLLRMSDLIATCPNLNIMCFIVVPENRESLVIKQLSRPTFQSLDLNRHCGFFTIECLKAKWNAMMEWAKDPASIKQLAQFVGDSSQ